MLGFLRIAIYKPSKYLWRKFISEEIRSHIYIVKIRHFIHFYWDLYPRLKKQLSHKMTLNHLSQYKDVKVLVPLIETSHYQYLQTLIIAKGLQLRGAKVKILLCGQSLDACEIKSIHTEKSKNPCWKCKFNDQKVLPLFGFDVVRLNEILGREAFLNLDKEAESVASLKGNSVVKYGVDLTQCIEDSIIRYYYGAVPSVTEEVQALRKKSIKTALISMEVAKRLHESWEPDVILAHMSVYTEWEPYFKYFSSIGVKFSLVSITQYDLNAIIFNFHELYSSQRRFELYLETRKTQYLTKEEKGLLTDFMNARTSGLSPIFKKIACFSEEKNSIPKQLKFNPKVRNIFLFSNVYWDVGISEMGGLYSGVLQWVESTIDLLKDREDCHLYVKPHPAEIFDSAPSLKGVSEFIREKYPELPENVTVIDPRWKINTYDLFSFIDVGVVFSGTLGIEMLLAGIPVIKTGCIPCQKLGFTMEPETIEAYKDFLLGQKSAGEIDKNQLDLFAYFYFLRASIPWKLTKTAYSAVDYEGYTFDKAEDLLPNKDPNFDHLCHCVIDPENVVPEAWPG